MESNDLISPTPHTRSHDNFLFRVQTKKGCFFPLCFIIHRPHLRGKKTKQRCYKRTEFNSANYESNIAESAKSQKKDLFSVKKRKGEEKRENSGDTTGDANAHRITKLLWRVKKKKDSVWPLIFAPHAVLNSLRCGGKKIKKSKAPITNTIHPLIDANEMHP